MHTIYTLHDEQFMLDVDEHDDPGVMADAIEAAIVEDHPELRGEALQLRIADSLLDGLAGDEEEILLGDLTDAADGDPDQELEEPTDDPAQDETSEDEFFNELPEDA